MREDGSSQYAYWFQARNIPDYETAYQKVCIILLCYASFTDHANVQCILGYLSDLRLCVYTLCAREGCPLSNLFRRIGTVAQTLGLKGYAMATGAQALGMSSTIDHSIYYYSDSLDCGDSLLYVVRIFFAAWSSADRSPDDCFSCCIWSRGGPRTAVY